MIHFRDKNSLPVTHVRVNIDEKRDSAKNVLDHLIYVYTCILEYPRFFLTLEIFFQILDTFWKVYTYLHI